MASSDTALRAQATRFAAGLSWPGKEAPQPQARPLTAAEQARYAAGEQQYLGTCAGCHGKEGEMLMPPIGGSLTNDQIANVLTYVRRSWGNSASPIDPADVAEVRGATAGRNRPWTEAELARVTR